MRDEAAGEQQAEAGRVSPSVPAHPCRICRKAIDTHTLTAGGEVCYDCATATTAEQQQTAKASSPQPIATCPDCGTQCATCWQRRPVPPLDSADVLVLRQHYAELVSTCKRADRYIVQTAKSLDSADADRSPTMDAWRREQLRGFVRNVRVLVNVLNARIGEAGE